MADQPSEPPSKPSDRSPSNPGHFLPGNGASKGRQHGQRNVRTKQMNALLAQEGRALFQKAVEVAMSGDATLLRAFLDRLVPAPKGRLIRFPVPLPASADLAYETIINAVGGGLLTTSEARDLAELLMARQGATEISDLQMRMAAMEERMYAATSREP
jgi:hypothetical protein